MITIQQQKIPGVYLIESSAFQDERGSLSRFFCAAELKNVLGDRQIVQMNYSITHQVGAVRGMHYQNPPHAEMKIIRCLRGRVFDVAVDLRRDSKTFLNWVAVELTPTSRYALVIPEGCAHGFQTLEPDCELLYLHTAFYIPEVEGGVRFDDKTLSIDWPLPPIDISLRDQNHALIKENYVGITV